MIDWQAFHFIRPEWFYAVIPAMLIWALSRFIAKYQSGWHGVISQHLYQRMLGQHSTKINHRSLNVLLIGWIILIAGMAGPTWERLPQPVYQLQTGHVLVLDMSMSMRATDVSPDRLTRAKYKAIDLVNSINEGELGLVAYAGDAFVISPLTTDANNIATLVPSLSPEIMPTSGSAPITGIEAASELLKNAGYKDGFIYWITDGIELSDVAEVRKFVSESPYTLNVLAVGTQAGAPIKQLNGELLKSRTGAIVIPKVDSASLKALAKAGQGRFAEMTPDESDINYLSTLSTLETQQNAEANDTENAGDQWQEQGPWLVLLVLPFAIYAFRRGVLIVLCTLSIGIAMPDMVYAQDSVSSTSSPWWKRPFQNANQRGLESYANENFEDAAAHFDDSNWKGSALYKAGDYQGALREFAKDSSPTGLFNQSNALAQLGELDDAISTLDDLLAIEPDNQDALHNKALLEQLKEQQEQEQDKQEQDSSEQNEQGEQNSDSSEQGDSEQQDQQGDPSESENQDAQQGDQSQQSGEQSEQDSQQQGQQQEQAPAQEEQDDRQQQDGEGQKSEEESQQAAAVSESEMTDEQKEQQQRLENLMRRIPDDPAFLLKRKMQLEAQKRRRERLPASKRSEW